MYRTLRSNGWVHDDPRQCEICGGRRAVENADGTFLAVDGDAACQQCADLHQNDHTIGTVQLDLDNLRAAAGEH